MYKLLVLDMDGTLLNEHQKISAVDLKAVKEAIELGVHIAIATGRTMQGIIPYLEELELNHSNAYSIVCSGAHILCNDGQTMAYNGLSQEDFSEIYHVKDSLNLSINVYSTSEILIEEVNYYSEFDAIANNLPLKLVNLKSIGREIPLLKAMLINEDYSMAKDFNRIFPSMDVKCPLHTARKGYNKKLFKDLSFLSESFLERFNVSKVTPYNIEISKKSANKRYGVEEIAQHLSIKQEEIICIGDSGNDRQMIEYAGLGIAMANAFPEIKAIADVITDSNMNGGVAKAIHQYILMPKKASR